MSIQFTNINSDRISQPLQFILLVHCIYKAYIAKINSFISKNEKHYILGT